MTTRVLTRGTAVGAADLTVEVCPAVAFGEACGLRPRKSPWPVPSQPTSGTDKRTGRPFPASITPSVVTPSHSLRVPMHLTQVPRA